MHSALNRIQNVFGFFTTIAFFVAALTALSVFLHPANPTASVELRNIQIVKGRPHYYSPKKEEYAHIRFDLDADFSSLFNWNTKQLFVYVLASYPSKNTTISSPSSQQANSEAIIWDTIIPAPLTPFSVSNIKSRYFPEKQTSKTKKSTKKPPKPDASPSKPGILKLANQKPKYQITDISGKLAERTNATLVVGWNVQPWVGALLWSNENLFRGRSGVAGTGRSRAFDFPALKGSRVEALKDAGVKSEGARVKPEAGSAEAVV